MKNHSTTLSLILQGEQLAFLHECLYLIEGLKKRKKWDNCFAENYAYISGCYFPMNHDSCNGTCQSGVLTESWSQCMGAHYSCFCHFTTSVQGPYWEGEVVFHFTSDNHILTVLLLSPSRGPPLLEMPAVLSNYENVEEKVLQVGKQRVVLAPLNVPVAGVYKGWVCGWGGFEPWFWLCWHLERSSDVEH